MGGKGKRARTARTAEAQGGDREQLIAAVFGDDSKAPLKEGEIALARIQSYWPDIAGSLSKHAQPARIQGRTLYVRVEKSVYSQELQLLSREILHRAKTLCGQEMDRIFIEKGPIDWGAAGGSRIPVPKGRKSGSVSSENKDMRESLPGETRAFLDGLKALGAESETSST